MLHRAVHEESKKVVLPRITKGNVHDTKKFGHLQETKDVYKIICQLIEHKLSLYVKSEMSES